ncbi:MAG: SIS domain-containing protein [Candidatus Woesebacteria bacterium]|jgi:glucose/mannose-6-phosphate isomerase
MKTATLDNREQIGKIDSENVLGSVEKLSKQCEDAWQQAKDIQVPESYKDINNIIMTGMGGSGLGARIIESVYHDDLNYPLIRVHDYDLPNFVDHQSLVICSSYSGTTEEIVSCAKQAVERDAKWMAIGTGNTLLNIAKEHNVPFYQMEPNFNPSNQPRMAIGYSVVGQLVMASKAGVFHLEKHDILKIVNAMKRVLEKNNVELEFSKNNAKQLASRLLGKDVFFIAARHLAGAVHTVNNQLNENAKTFSADFQIPELNHHLMEGLKHPKENTERLFMFFANSTLYPEKIQKRFEITMEVVEKNNLEYFEFVPKSKDKLSQAFELIQFGAFVNLYLSVLYGQNPAPIPWVDYFKKRLVQPLGKKN